MTTVTPAETLIAATREGRGGSHFIVGGVGLGKTTALAEIAATASRFGLRVLRCQGNAMERSLPLALVSQFSPDPTEPTDSGRVGEWGPRAVRLLRSLTTEPTVVLIDDLQWADPESLLALGYLCRRTRSAPSPTASPHLSPGASAHLSPGLSPGGTTPTPPAAFAVIATLRPWPSDAAALSLDLSAGGHASIDRLAPLTEAATAVMLEQRLGHPLPAASVAALWHRSGGIPLLLEAVVPGAEDKDPRLQLSDAHIGALLGGLDPGAVRCAEAASVFGEPFPADLAADIARFDEATGDVALDALCRSGVLRETPDGSLEFALESLRDALYRRVSPPMRARFHARAFTALVRRGFESQAADHAMKAGLAAGAEAVPILAKVAERAMHDGAVASAADHLRTAVELAGDHAGFDLRLSLGQALLAAGRPIAAGSILQRLLGNRDPAPDPADRMVALAALASACHAAGRRTSAIAHFTRVAEMAAPELPERGADALVNLALVGWQIEGLPRALALATRSRDLTPPGGDPSRLRRIEAGTAYLRLLGGDASHLAPLEEAAVATLDGSLRKRNPIPPAVGIAASFAQATTAVGRLHEADRFLDSALAIAGPSGAEPVAAPLLVARADTMIRLGRLDAALIFATEAVVGSRAAPGTNAMALAIEAHALLQMGREDDSQMACHRAEGLVREGQEPLAMLWVGHVRAQRHLLRGEAAAASAQYSEIEKAGQAMGLVEPCIVPWAMHAMLAHLDAGDTGRAEGLIAQVDATTLRLPCAWPRMAVAVGRALLAERRGEDDIAEQQFRTALILAEGGGLELDRIFILWRHGGFLRRAGRQVEARRLLAEGLRLAEAAGAGLLARHLAVEVSVAGGRRSRRGSAGDALTPQESRIVELAAGGRTNREIAGSLSLSVNTVETHLQRAFAKLGVTARLQLAATGGSRGEAA